MIVGVLRVRLIIRHAKSLKDKRQVALSIKDKLRNSFNVSVAEIEDQDARQSLVLGIAMVSNETHHVKVALAQVVEALKVHPIAEFVDQELEVIPV